MAAIVQDMGSKGLIAVDRGRFDFDRARRTGLSRNPGDAATHVRDPIGAARSGRTARPAKC